MSLENKIQEYIVNNTSDKDNNPDYWSIEFPSECIWDVDNNQDIVIVANWKVKAPEDWNANIKDDKRYIYITENDKLYSEIMNVLLTQYDNISIFDNYTELSSLSLKPSPTYSENYSPEWSDKIQDTYSIMLCKNYRDIDSKDKELINKTINTIENLFGEEDIDLNCIHNMILYFDDFNINRLSSFRIYLETSKPHLYYSDVNTLEEYILNANGKKEKLRKQDTYEVFISLGFGDEDERRDNIPDEIVDLSESLMRHRMDTIIGCHNTSYTLEGESIIIDGESSETNFWIRQNIQ